MTLILTAALSTIRGPKGGKDQIIPLNQAAREVLESHPRDDDIPFVFPGRGGAATHRYPKRIDAIESGRDSPGLPAPAWPETHLRLHAGLIGQVDLYTLQKLLTHKSAAMTQRYAHLRDEPCAGRPTWRGTYRPGDERQKPPQGCATTAGRLGGTMEAHNEVDLLCSKVKAISQGPNAELLKKFIDLLYEQELGSRSRNTFRRRPGRH